MPIGINTEKAKQLQKARIRTVRDPLLKDEDIKFMRAVESGDTVAQESIRTKKQLLRDATNVVDNVEITSTGVTDITNELKVVWDTEALGEMPPHDEICSYND